MPLITQWLKSLDLEQYAQSFADNAIDFDILPDLTDQDLEKMGVLLGHRRKMLRAIANASPSPPEHPASNSPAADSAERRQLTLMFGNLTGAAALSLRVDPEDLRILYRAFEDRCAEVIARYDGLVAQFMGDSVLAYFGYPKAHEDDAERAVRAGLELAAIIGALPTPFDEPVQARFGIATGLVVVGDLVGQGAMQEQAVVGSTANLAARLQDVATAGAVVVADSTRLLLGDVFALDRLAALSVRGLAAPVTAWTVLGETPSESRFATARTRRLTGFVGRSQEMVVLRHRQQLAWEGHGQGVLISGEAGIGKSRFVARLVHELGEKPYTRLHYQCSPYHTASAFYPIIERLKRVAGFQPDESTERKLDRLETALAPVSPDVATVAPLFATLLQLPSEGRYPPLALSPAQRRQLLFRTLLDQLESFARQRPVLLIFEDVHWADPSSLELLSMTMARIAHLPVLALITCRPEYTDSWSHEANVTRLDLMRLDPAQVQSMVDQLVGKKLPGEVMAQIVAKTDGIPLFVEELTKAVLESGLLVEHQESYRLSGPLPSLAIPTTLRDSLMARLDRIATVKEVAEMGALIGREFSFALLHAASGLPRQRLEDALAQLESAELIYRVAGPPDPRFRFKHALVQEAAYETLLISRRQVLHRRIADTLLERFPATAAAEPDTIARHYTQCDLAEPAAEWWRKAAAQALERLAYVEAIAHFRQAITQMDTLAPSAEQLQPRLRLQLDYALTLIAARGHAAPETTAAFSRARELAASIENPVSRLPIYFGLWVGHYVRGEVAAARELTNAYLREAEHISDPAWSTVGQAIAGITGYMAGELTAARARFEYMHAHPDPVADQAARSLTGQDPQVASALLLGLVLWQLGQVKRARVLAEEAVRLAIDSRHIPTLVFAYCYKCIFEAIRRDRERTASSAAMLRDISAEHAPGSNWFFSAEFFAAWARCSPNDPDAAAEIATMRESVQRHTEQNLLFFVSLWQVMRAAVDAAAGHTETALGELEDTIAHCEQTGLLWCRSELYRQRGELLRLRTPDDTNAAELAFEQALAVARTQRALTLELRAALGLARLYDTTHRAQAARDLLLPLLRSPGELVELPEYAEACALLENAAAPHP